MFVAQEVMAFCPLILHVIYCSTPFCDDANAGPKDEYSSSFAYRISLMETYLLQYRRDLFPLLPIGCASTLEPF